ncbi:hypothetical protein [Streptococcus agalactiae]|uniref:hypothetical protein n=1 Tax=Streptococcus agalactiae TaxID=1311 RepID=UPI0037525A04
MKTEQDERMCRVDLHCKSVNDKKNNKSVSETEKSKAQTFNESLILAQDERWRRA